MRKSTLLLLAVFLGGALSAAVPNRITYQGRLFKSGVAVSGSKSIRLALVHPSTLVELESEVFNVTLPATGEFTIVWDATLDPGFDWRGVNPQLKISVDGEALSPNELLGVSPYSFVARRVDVGGVDTAALADGAVTNAKVAVGVEASKILITTNTYLSDWRHPAQQDKIDASKVFPPLAVDSIIFSSPSVAQFIQASQPVTPLTIKGKSGVVGTVPVFDVRDNADILRFRIRGAGEQYFSGPIGVGTEAPGAPIDLVSSSAAIVMRNTQAPEATRTWQMAVNNTGKMQIQATNAALGSPVTALTLSRDGSIDIPTARISSSTIQNLNTTSLVTQNLTATTLGIGSVVAGPVSADTVTAGTMTVTGPTSLSGNLTVSGTTTLGAVSANTMTSTNINGTNVAVANFNTTNVTATNITASNITATQGLSGQWLAAPYPMMIVEDIKPSGTTGGGFPSGSWQVRVLNTITTNTIVGASLASNSVTLPSGSYRVTWRTTAFKVDLHKSLWRNVTDNANVIIGGNSAGDRFNDVGSDSLGFGVFAIASTKAFQLWHRTNSNGAELGVPTGFGVNEVYSQVLIEKIK